MADQNEREIPARLLPRPRLTINGWHIWGIVCLVIAFLILTQGPDQETILIGSGVFFLGGVICIVGGSIIGAVESAWRALKRIECLLSDDGKA